MKAPFILQLCFCWIFARWLRSRNLASFAENIETGPARSFPNPRAEGRGFPRQPPQHGRKVDLVVGGLGSKFVSPEPEDAAARAAASFRAADFRSERASLS
jgi:hypothetical protein